MRLLSFQNYQLFLPAQKWEIQLQNQYDRVSNNPKNSLRFLTHYRHIKSPTKQLSASSLANNGNPCEFLALKLRTHSGYKKRLKIGKLPQGVATYRRIPGAEHERMMIIRLSQAHNVTGRQKQQQCAGTWLRIIKQLIIIISQNQ